MSHRSSTLIRRAASRARSITVSTARERLRQRRELVLTLVFWALALIALLAGLLAQTDAASDAAPVPAASAPAPAVSAPAAPAPTTTAAQPGQQVQPPASRPAQPSAQRSYQVRPGDTLASIALRHGVDYQRIAADNRLVDPNRIRPGQTLRIGAPTPGVRLIAPGDTLTGLGGATGLSVHELRVLNPWITHPDRIPAGAGLRVRR